MLSHVLGLPGSCCLCSGRPGEDFRDNTREGVATQLCREAEQESSLQMDGRKAEGTACAKAWKMQGTAMKVEGLGQ